MNLKKFKKQLVRKLPKWIRTRVVRHHFPPVSLNLDHIVFKPAETFDEYIKSFRLVHDVYVDAGYIEPSSSALRIIPHHSHKDSRVFLGMYCNGDQEIPIYSLSIFPDSKEEGLPMDLAFKDELDKLRAQSRFLAEAGCLASEPLFRKNDMNIPMLGNRIMQLYARKHLDADDLVITVHPKFQWIYEDILMFEKLGEIKEYAYVKNNPAVAMRLNLRTFEQRYRQVYGAKPMEKNLHHFFFKGESESTYLPSKESVESRELFNTLLLYYLSTSKNGG